MEFLSEQWLKFQWRRERGPEYSRWNARTINLENSEKYGRNEGRWIFRKEIFFLKFCLKILLFRSSETRNIFYFFSKKIPLIIDFYGGHSRFREFLKCSILFIFIFSGHSLFIRHLTVLYRIKNAFFKFYFFRKKVSRPLDTLIFLVSFLIFNLNKFQTFKFENSVAERVYSPRGLGQENGIF